MFDEENIFEERNVTVAYVTETYRSTLRQHLKGLVDFLDWENRFEGLEGVDGAPLGMYAFPIGNESQFDDCRTSYDYEVRAFVQAIRAANELSLMDGANYKMEVGGEKHGFCIMTVPEKYLWH